jgi:hypothetical protein
MGVPTSEVGYTSATTGRGDHEVHKGHVVALGEKTHISWNPPTCFGDKSSPQKEVGTKEYIIRIMFGCTGGVHSRIFMFFYIFKRSKYC